MAADYRLYMPVMSCYGVLVSEGSALCDAGTVCCGRIDIDDAVEELHRCKSCKRTPAYISTSVA